MSENLLSQLPKMDLLLSRPALLEARARLPYSALHQAARDVLDGLRLALRGGGSAQLPDMAVLEGRVLAAAEALCRPHLRRVINATGVVLHTNLGRAPLCPAAADAAYSAAKSYCNLEYNLEAGSRGIRFAHVEALLCALTGAEAALVVNNNAACVFLMLSALASGKRVAISRGELVEIGGSFRVPEMMARSGAELLEVGTTNKTRIGDYAAAVRDQGAEVLLKVHTSNYQILGFTEETSLAELAALGRETGLPLFYDLGSGALSQDFLPNLPAGPNVADSLAAGADLVCFSGDKLLGGPQAGIAVGKKKYIDAMKQDPMARVTRIDKLSLAALEATLRLCRDPAEAIAAIPTLSMLNMSPDLLQQRAEGFAARLEAVCGDALAVAALPMDGEVGGGSMPTVPLPSYGLSLTPKNGQVQALEQRLRASAVPIVGRISRDRLLLDLRTLTEEDCDEIIAALTREDK
ncbi:MAG: L-seryl-tRNA(Sec) selenium transferase [Pseudoflavonifractor sp.]